MVSTLLSVIQFKKKKKKKNELLGILPASNRLMGFTSDGAPVTRGKNHSFQSKINRIITVAYFYLMYKSPPKTKPTS